MLVDRFGTVYEGRRGGFDTGIVGAHASGVNTGTFGVAVLGTYSSRAVPSAVTDAVAKIAVWQGQRWGYDPTTSVKITSGGGGSSRFKAGTTVTLPRIFAHRDVGYTDCPGNSLYSKLGTIRSKAKELQKPAYKTSGPIGEFYAEHKSTTGIPTQEMKCGLRDGGCFQKFKNGSVHWSKKSGAHFTRAGGPIQKKWGEGKWERGPLGYPTSEQVNFKYRSGAYYQNFQNGMIIHHKDTGTWILKGAIRSKWKSLGWERGFSKLPISDEKCGLKNRGCYQKFEGSSIHWSSATGAHATKRSSPIQKKWGAGKYENGALGYPTSEPMDMKFRSGAVMQNFQGGTIIYHKNTGAWIVKGKIGSKWKALGWERGYSKLPISDEKCGLKNRGCYQKFEGSSIHFSPETGAHATRRGSAIQKAWGGQKYENGRLGYPTSEEFTWGSYVRQEFQGGYILWKRDGNTTTIKYTR